MGVKQSFISIFLGVALAFTAPTTLANEPKTPNEQERAQAKKLYEKAEAAYKAKDYPKALASYREAYLITLSSGLLFNIAQCYRLIGRNREALEAYELFLKDVPNTPVRKDVEGLIADLKVLVAAQEKIGATLEVSSDHDPAEVYLDGSSVGQTPLSLGKLASGEHLLALRKEGFLPYEKTISLQPDQKFALQANLQAVTAKGEEKDKGRTPRLSTKLFLGAGALGAFGAATGVLGINAALQSSQLQDERNLALSLEKRETAILFGKATDVLIGAAILTGGVSYFLRVKENKKEAEKTTGVNP